MTLPAGVWTSLGTGPLQITASSNNQASYAISTTQPSVGALPKGFPIYDSPTPCNTTSSCWGMPTGASQVTVLVSPVSGGIGFNGTQVSGTPGSGAGAFDNAAMINGALSGNPGKAAYLASGTYHVANQINLPPGQCLYGDPGWGTTLDVDYDFAPSASGIIVVTPTTNVPNVKPCVHNIVFNEHLPPDISATASAASAGSNVLTVSGATGTIVSGMSVYDVTHQNSIPNANGSYPTEVVGVSGSTVNVIAVGLSAGGSGYTNGPQTLTASGGTCTTAPQFNVNVVNGVVSGASITAAAINAACSVWPSGAAVATTGGGGTGATLNLAGIAGNVSANDSIHFAAPRSSAQALGSCNTTVAGAGACKYPWIVYNNGAQSLDLDYLLAPYAWNGIYQRGSTFHFGYIQIGAFNVGMDTDGATNFSQIDNYMFWDFRLRLTANSALSNLYYDGANIAANIGATAGVSIGKMQIWQGNLNFTSNFDWAHIGSLMLDVNAAWSISACQWVQIGKLYSTNGQQVTAPALSINAPGCRVAIDDIWLTYPSGFGTPAIQLTSGELSISHGKMCDTIPNAAAPLIASAGNLLVHNVNLGCATPGANSVVVSQTSGWLVFQNNVFTGTPPTGGVGLSATDNAKNIVTGNNWNGWGFTPPGPLGSYPRQNLQAFTSSGTYTPSQGLAFAEVWCIGQGGGGGGGLQVASGTADSGGSGGGGGSIAYGVFTAAQLGASAAVTINTNANGGAAGASGTVGGNSNFGGGKLLAYGGGGGQVGVSAAASQGGGGAGQFQIGQAGTSGGTGGTGGGGNGSSGAAGASTQAMGAGAGGGGGASGAIGKNGGNGPWAPAGGASGGGVSTTPGAFAGGAGGQALGGTGSAGAAGSVSASGGSAPAAPNATPGVGVFQVSWPGGAGGGGGGSTAGAGAFGGGAGAAGGFPGGGGGGGGSALTTSTNGAGAGGQGGAGACYVLERF